MIPVEGWMLLAFFAILFGTYLFTRLKNTDALLSGAQALISIGQKLVDDGNPTSLSPTEKLIQYARLAVDAAEQMYKSGQLPANQRKQAAIDIVQKLFKADFPDAEFDQSLITLTGDVVEALVLWLNKSNPNPPTPPAPENPAPDTPPASTSTSSAPASVSTAPSTTTL